MSRTALAAFSGLCLFFLYWPMLGQSFALDNIDIQWIVSRSHREPLGPVFKELWERSMLPHYFRPLAAPIYLILFEVFGVTPIPIRTIIALMDLWILCSIFRIGEKMNNEPAAGFLAAALYGLTWIHWGAFAMTSLPQVVAHALFWQSLWMFVAAETAGGFSRFLVALIPVTLGLGFKEDLVIFPMFVLALCPWRAPLRADFKRLCRVFAGWSAAYAAARLFLLPGSFTSTHNFYRMDLRGVLRPWNYGRVLSFLSEPLRHPGLTGATRSGFFEYFGGTPWLAAAWVCACLALGYWLGRCAWNLASGRLKAQPRPSGTAGALASLSVIGFIAGVIPYAAFNAMEPWDCHRFTLAWGALSIGLGGCACWLSRGRGAPWVYALAGMAVFLRTAVAVRFPDPELPPFNHLHLVYETGRSLETIRRGIDGEWSPGDRIVLLGFDRMQRLQELLVALEGRPMDVQSIPEDATATSPREWLIERRVVQDEICLIVTRESSRTRKEYRFSARPSLY